MQMMLVIRPAVTCGMQASKFGDQPRLAQSDSGGRSQVRHARGHRLGLRSRIIHAAGW
jgi:hypothetical protein